jgi:hypothetical protein
MEVSGQLRAPAAQGQLYLYHPTIDATMCSTKQWQRILYVIRVWCLIKHQKKHTFPLYMTCFTKHRIYLGSEVLTAVVLMISVLWDITRCSPLKVNRRFGGGIS